MKFLDYFKENDFYTYRHMLVVFALSTVLSREMLQSNSYLLAETAAAPLHDFGNICVPLEILKKEKPLTAVEQEMLQHHTLAGYVLLTYYLHDEGHLAARMARDHHERKDGSGYPMGTAHEDIPVEIVTVCDIYDALLSPRAFRQVLYDNRSALDEICRKGEIGKINRLVARALVACNRKDNPHYMECSLAERKREAPSVENVYVER
jgi:HD-GYP domain-containing protein (c-di-GMP phosphodiesterase class II)